MPNLTTVCYYAMYVIGEVESHWTWTAVNYNDPITIGIMQWYGTRAAALLNRVKDEQASAYGMLASSLRSSIESHAPTDTWWNSRELNREEGNSIVEVFSIDANHSIQENQAIADFTGYVNILQDWGFSLDNPKPLIFAMAMYHQSPKSCNRVCQTAGGQATLDRIHGVCLNDSVLGRYPTRYNTVKSRLDAWDGESMPPDFGQNGSEVGGGGGDSGGISTESPRVNYVIQQGDCLVIYGSAWPNGLLCYKSQGQTWQPALYTGGDQIAPDWTGGGASTDVQKVVDLYTSWVGRFAYSQGGGRLSPLTSGYGDCSSTIWFAYHETMGIDVGTYTGAMIGKGSEVGRGSGANLPLSSMLPGDLVLMGSSSSSPSHVEMYVGNNRLCGHGGPGNGPTIKPDANAYVRNWGGWNVRRYA